MLKFHSPEIEHDVYKASPNTSERFQSKHVSTSTINKQYGPPPCDTTMLTIAPALHWPGPEEANVITPGSVIFSVTRPA